MSYLQPTPVCGGPARQVCMVKSCSSQPRAAYTTVTEADKIWQTAR